MMRSRLLHLLLACGLIATWPTRAGAESPTQVIRRTQARLEQLLGKKTAASSPAQKRIDEQVKALVNSFLDYPELARLALAKHWEARTPEEQQEFTGILKQLIERNYIKQLKSNHGYKIEYRKETMQGTTASVLSVVKVVKNGRTTEVSIEYKMRKTPDGWMVYDVITDDVSIVRNYRSQFNRIIGRESYEALVKKMRSKLDERS